MPLDLYMTFLAASAGFIAIPGPNVAFIVATSIARGWRAGLATVAGTSTGTMVQLVVTVLGVSALLSVMAGLLDWVRWAGVVYLVLLGVRAWRAPPADLTQVRPEPRSARASFLRGVLVSITNPKTLVFYAAFLPQFLTGTSGFAAQLGLLAGTFLAIAVVFDGSWALLAGHLRGFLAVHGRVRNRITGMLLIGAAIGLALAQAS
jgi:homoserine/homoserine lactone efflux protein